MITKFLRKLADRPARVKRRKQREALERQTPLAASSDDTYIAAFAKSGGTWFSFLLANVNLQLNKLPQTATWWNIRDYIFDIHESRHMPPSPFCASARAFYPHPFRFQSPLPARALSYP